MTRPSAAAAPPPRRQPSPPETSPPDGSVRLLGAQLPADLRWPAGVPYLRLASPLRETRLAVFHIRPLAVCALMARLTFFKALF